VTVVILTIVGGWLVVSVLTAVLFAMLGRAALQEDQAQEDLVHRG